MSREPEAPAKGRLNAAISQAVQRVHQRYVGRGPTKARTLAHGDVVLTVLEDGLTKAERSLVATGKADAVQSMRRAFQDTMRDDMVAEVERLTGARVRAFLSQQDVVNDLAAEVFILDGPLRGDGALADG